MGFRAAGRLRAAYLFDIVLSAWLLGPWNVLIGGFTTDVATMITIEFTSGIDWLSFDNFSISLCNKKSKGSKSLFFSRKSNFPFTSSDSESQNIHFSYLEIPKKFFGVKVFKPGMPITTSLKYECDLDLNKDCSNLISNFKPSIVLIGSDSRETYLSRTRVCGLSNCFLNFRILSRSSIGSWGIGSWLLWVCLMLEEDKIS